jgi:DNA helicase-2/ATP-dependent DNA helicase PcrA
MIVPSMTPPQLRAATSNDRLCYVKAGPGSGKTFTAAEAFGYLRLVRYRHDSRGICGVTFARSARRELTSRVRARWGQRVARWPNAICTFDELHRRLIRYLVQMGYVEWPGGQVPDKPEDSWAQHLDATPRPGNKPRLRLGLNKRGEVAVFQTNSKIRAPSPVFLDRTKFLTALTSGACTHADIRNVLSDAINKTNHPGLSDAIGACLAGSYCHLVIDEAFDMNPLDIAVVQRAIEEGLSVTIVGDPWQSLYEFRGATPKQVDAMIASQPFRRIDMPGEHRYKSAEMLELARALFHNEPFEVHSGEEGDEFDIVLAHDWGTLWDESRISLVPAGKPSKLDRSLMASTFVLLLNEVVRERFGLEASGIGEARRALAVDDASERLAPVVQALRDPAIDEDEVWDLLRSTFQPDDRRWPSPGATAKACLHRLVAGERDADPPLLGLSVHQAKGLEWDRVLFLDGELTTNPREMNLLDINELSHRNVYVALTRAQSRLRIARVATNPYGVPRSPIERLRKP